jgi:competence protein ComEC
MLLSFKKLLKNKKFRTAAIIITAAVLVFSFLKTYVPSLGFSPWNETLNSVKTIGRANEADEKPLSVHFLDVGQADCILIKTEYGNALIDTGNSTDDVFVRRYLLSHNVDEIEYLVLTHLHEDHSGGAADIINGFKVRNVIMHKTDESLIPDEVFYQRFTKAVDENRPEVIYAEAGNEFSLGEVRLTVLAPLKEYDELNNLSIVIRLDYMDTSFLFMGDAQADEEADIIESKSDIDCDVIKLGHHGSMKSNSERFLKEVSPLIAVISCGFDNSYGHPGRYTLETLEYMKIPYLRTDFNGTVVIGSDGEKLYCYHEKGERF